MKIQNQLGYIKGITFAPFHRRGSLSTQTARDSFDYMIEHTAADFEYDIGTKVWWYQW